ncbi:MAG: hypothetical protein L3J82_02415 [Planctomycetes bacterium]|nr:hypothetical protein [Planctomycetota bacterium]
MNKLTLRLSVLSLGLALCVLFILSACEDGGDSDSGGGGSSGSSAPVITTPNATGNIIVGGSAPNFTGSSAFGGDLAITFTATDADAADTLTTTVSVTGGSLTAVQAGFKESFPATLIPSVSPNAFSFTGTAVTAGTIELTISVDDGNGGIGQALFTLTVTDQYITLSAPPATWVTMIDDTMNRLQARWDATSRGKTFDVGPYSPTSITSVGTTATVTLPGHNFIVGDEVWVRREGGAADDDYSSRYNVKNVVISNVTANTFDYQMPQDMGNAPATGSPLVFNSPWDWLGSTSVAVGYYGPYYNLVGYIDWLDRTGRASSSPWTPYRQKLVNGEMPRCQFSWTSGYARMYQAPYLAVLENENYLGLPITLGQVRKWHETGAFNSSQINAYLSDKRVYNSYWSREWAYLLGALIGAEKVGDTRHAELLNLKDALISHIYKMMWETTSQYPSVDNPASQANWTPSTTYAVGGSVWNPDQGGFFYTCRTAHTSAATFDASKFSRIRGDTAFMMALTSMALIQFHDWEVANSRNPDAQWPTTLFQFDDDTVTTVANPWTSLLDCLTDFHKWMHNYSSLSGDTTPANRNTAYNAGYFRRTHPNFLGTPVFATDPTDNNLLKTTYRNFGTQTFSNTLMSMNVPALFWLANQHRSTDLSLAQYFADKGDECWTTAGAEYPYVAGYGGPIKEGNQRIWYTFDALTWRNQASNRND